MNSVGCFVNVTNIFAHKKQCILMHARIFYYDFRRKSSISLYFTHFDTFLVVKYSLFMSTPTYARSRIFAYLSVICIILLLFSNPLPLLRRLHPIHLFSRLHGIMRLNLVCRSVSNLFTENLFTFFPFDAIIS